MARSKKQKAVGGVEEPIQAMPEATEPASTSEPPVEPFEAAVLTPPELITRPRTVVSDTIVHFQWFGQSWYGADAQSDGVDGIAFLPAAHFVIVQSLAIAPRQALASASFFMSRRQFEQETQPTEPPSEETARAVVETIGMEEPY